MMIYNDDDDNNDKIIISLDYVVRVRAWGEKRKKKEEVEWLYERIEFERLFINSLHLFCSKKIFEVQFKID
jgi:hypothetical protein